MRKNLILVGFGCLFASCSVPRTDTVERETLTLSEFLVKADSITDDTITLKGVASHVCHGSKKKFFMVDNNDTTLSPIRILAGGVVDTFSFDLKGKEVEIDGIVRMRKITKAVMEEQIHTLDSLISGMPVDENKGTPERGCSMGMKLSKKKAAVEDKLKQLEASGNDYLPDYYIESINQPEVIR